eukprot:gene13798-biopygen3742
MCKGLGEPTWMGGRVNAMRLGEVVLLGDINKENQHNQGKERKGERTGAAVSAGSTASIRAQFLGAN